MVDAVANLAAEIGEKPFDVAASQEVHDAIGLLVPKTVTRAPGVCPARDAISRTLASGSARAEPGLFRAGRGFDRASSWSITARPSSSQLGGWAGFSSKKAWKYKR